MNQSVEGKHFRGVVCVRCRQPIPVPSVVGRKGTSTRSIGQNSPQEMNSRVFTLRCRACQSEHPYTTTQIVDCEDAPGPRPSGRSFADGALGYGENATRAANG
jgi:hypothetical protein